MVKIPLCSLQGLAWQRWVATGGKKNFIGGTQKFKRLNIQFYITY
jgi:hypothetical protein